MSSPFPWRQYEETWTKAHCRLLSDRPHDTLESCKARCLSDSSCTAFNFHVAAGSGCELRGCADGERPTHRLSGWQGYASYDRLSAHAMHPTVHLPGTSTKLLLLLLAILALTLAVNRRAVQRLLTASMAGVSTAGRGDGWSPRFSRVLGRLRHMEPLSPAQCGSFEEEDSEWTPASPVHTDPVHLTSDPAGAFLCSDAAGCCAQTAPDVGPGQRGGR